MRLQVFDNRDHPEADRRAVNLRIVHPDGYTVAYGVLVGDDPRRVAESIAAEPLVLEYVGPTEEERAARRPLDQLADFRPVREGVTAAPQRTLF